MQIKGLQKLTLIDFPGLLACTVFLANCNFRCPWCYSKELVLPDKVSALPRISEKDFFSFLWQRKKDLDGVVICGGEPCLNPDLAEFCRAIKQIGFKIKLNTNGSRPDVIEGLINEGLVDYLAMDVKAPKEKYAKLIGLEGCSLHYLLDNLEDSIELIKNSNLPYEFRTIFVPGLLTKDDILKIVFWLSPAQKYVLQNFKPGQTLDDNLAGLEPYSKEELFLIKEAIVPFFDDCQVR